MGFEEPNGYFLYLPYKNIQIMSKKNMQASRRGKMDEYFRKFSSENSENLINEIWCSLTLGFFLFIAVVRSTNYRFVWNEIISGSWLEQLLIDQRLMIKNIEMSMFIWVVWKKNPFWWNLRYIMPFKISCKSKINLQYLLNIFYKKY